MTTGDKYLDHAILIGVILLISFLIPKLLHFLLSKFLNRSSKQLNVDPTQYYFLKNALNSIILLTAVIVIMYSIPELR